MYLTLHRFGRCRRCRVKRGDAAASSLSRMRRAESSDRPAWRVLSMQKVCGGASTHDAGRQRRAPGSSPSPPSASRPPRPIAVHERVAGALRGARARTGLSEERSSRSRRRGHRGRDCARCAAPSAAGSVDLAFASRARGSVRHDDRLPGRPAPQPQPGRGDRLRRALTGDGRPLQHECPAPRALVCDSVVRDRT